MEKINEKTSFAISVWKEKCPHCGAGDVYQKNAPLLKMPVMNEVCSHCSYKFDREPGYFLGAMYVSYAIAVFFALLTFVACYFLLPGLPTIYFPLAIIFVILLIAKKNYKLSRVIYMHMFPW